MPGKCCFFIGHRETPDEIYPALYAAVQDHIVRCGVTEFVAGRYGNFDRLAAKAVREAAYDHPEVRLTMLLPYHPAERPVFVPEDFDGTCYPCGMEKVPRKAAIVRADRYMIDRADFLIAYARYAASNAKRLFDYAAGKATKGRITILNLYSSKHSP